MFLSGKGEGPRQGISMIYTLKVEIEGQNASDLASSSRKSLRPSPLPPVLEMASRALLTLCWTGS